MKEGKKLSMSKVKIRYSKQKQNPIVVVSYSRIKRWRFCKQAHYYQYVEGIEPRRKPKALKLGSIIHKMDEVKVQGGDWRDVLKEVKKEYDKMFVEEKEFYGDLPSEVERIMEGYEHAYPNDEKFKYSLVEETLGPVPLTEHTVLKLKPDKIVEDEEGLRLLGETKTGKRIPSEDFRMWDLQTILYVWGARQVGYEVDGILWNYIRTKPPALPQILKNGTLSKKQSIDTDYRTYLKAIKEIGGDPADYKEFLEGLRENTSRFFRRIRVPVAEKTIEPIVEDAKKTSLEIYYLQNYPVRELSAFTCPRCFYKNLCYAEMGGLDSGFVRESEFKKREREEEADIIGEEEENE